MKSYSSLCVLAVLFIAAWSLTETSNSISSKEADRVSNLLMVSDHWSVLCMDKDKLSTQEQSKWFAFSEELAAMPAYQGGTHFGIEINKKQIRIITQYDPITLLAFGDLIYSCCPKLSQRFIIVYNGKSYRAVLTKYLWHTPNDLSSKSSFAFYYVFDIVN